MSWWEILSIVVIGFLVLKFIFKPLFKLLALVALAATIWLLLMN